MKVVPRKRSCVLSDEERLFLFTRQEEDRMNWISNDKISALCVVIAGLLIAGFAKIVCRKAVNVPFVRRLGICMMVIGVILWFLS